MITIPSRRIFAIRSFATLVILAASVASGQEVLPDGTEAANGQIHQFIVPSGMKVELFAAEPQVSSPVALCVDEKGRVFVAEEYRFNRGTEENRTRPFLLDDDLQINTLKDRLAMFRKHAAEFEGGMEWFTRVSDQVRILEDRDGDGRADFSKVFAGGFNDPLDGMASGVIARDGDVYLTNIPHLWRLRDTNDDGIADIREPLLRGFGVNAAFLGHDLHGLVWGPSGRLYFSVGDRGFNVVSKEGRRFAQPRRGAVFRCDPDGKNFEVVHIGLRNPQELAFDEYGNLFADDNNCDKGDLSRLVYVVEGGDSGWNMAYQTMEDPYLTGPWHAENMWHVEAEGQPAWIAPPVGALGAGPSGFAYYPGVGLGHQFDGHFFMCNFTGNGGIETFSLRPHGASFRISSEKEFLKPIFATDLDFGYDGKVYVADFVGLDWNGPSRGGRVYSVFDPEYVSSASAAAIRQLFSSGFQGVETKRLLEYLGHDDMRVRQRAQFELARRMSESGDTNGIVELLLEAAQGENERRRRHAVWTLWQVARKDYRAVVALRSLLWKVLTDDVNDTNEQILRALGDLGDAHSIAHFSELLSHKSPRIQFLSAMALARVAKSSAAGLVDNIYKLLKQNADNDLYVRHACVMALARHASDESLATQVASFDRSVRLGVLLAARRRALNSFACRVLLTEFLSDSDLELVAEAARAINGLALVGKPEETLASLKVTSRHSESLVRRVIHANYRTGRADRLLEFVVTPSVPLSLRKEAFESLKAWPDGANRDRVNGDWRPVPARPEETIRELLESGWSKRLAEQVDGELLPDVILLLTRYKIEVDDSQLNQWANDPSRGSRARAASLTLLSRRKSEFVEPTVASFLISKDRSLRTAARKWLASSRPEEALQNIQATVAESNLTIVELQATCEILAGMNGDAADQIVRDLLSRVITPKPEPLWAGAELDIVMLAQPRIGNPIIEKLLVERDLLMKRLAGTTQLVEYRDALTGGNTQRGRELFRAHRQAQCLRCHKIGKTGGDAGPDLTNVGKTGDRFHILQSIVDPDAKLAKGFGQVTIVTDEGRIVGGTILDETAEFLVLKKPTGEIERIKIGQIEERIVGQSAMPKMRSLLNKREIRDLVEYLMTGKSS